MRWAIAAALCAVALAGCGDDSGGRTDGGISSAPAPDAISREDAEGVYREYMEAVLRGDVERACSLMTEDYQAAYIEQANSEQSADLSGEDCGEVTRKVGALLAAFGGPNPHLAFSSFRSQGDSATILARVGNSELERVAFVRDEEGVKLSGDETTEPADPAATGGTPAADAPDRDRYLAALNDICQDYNSSPELKRLRARMADLTTSDLDEAADVFRQAAELANSDSDRLANLIPPPEDHAAHDRYLAAVNRGNGVLARLAEAYEDGDLGRVQMLVQVQKKASEQRITAAIDLGADRCGQ